MIQKQSITLNLILRVKKIHNDDQSTNDGLQFWEKVQQGNYEFKTTAKHGISVNFALRQKVTQRNVSQKCCDVVPGTSSFKAVYWRTSPGRQKKKTEALEEEHFVCRR